MADVFTKAKRSEVMARIRGRGNKDTELALARLLRAHHVSGWGRHLLVRVTSDKWRVTGKSRSSIASRVTRHPTRIKLLGSRPSTFVPRLTVRPDFVFSKPRTVIFVDGCFWHGCPKHATQPKNNAGFWRAKLRGNRARDALVNRTLRRAGWRVLRVWEHELTRKNQARLVRRLQRALG